MLTKTNFILDISKIDNFSLFQFPQRISLFDSKQLFQTALYTITAGVSIELTTWNDETNTAFVTEMENSTEWQNAVAELGLTLNTKTVSSVSGLPSLTKEVVIPSSSTIRKISGQIIKSMIANNESGHIIADLDNNKIFISDNITFTV